MHIDEEGLAILEAYQETERALGDLESFRGWMSASGHADFVYPHMRHHAVMAEALERVVRGEVSRLMFMLPPGSAKSTIVSIQFSTWWWSLFPHHHILRCSATQALAEKFGRRCRSAVSTKEYARLSGATLDPQNQGVTHFGNTGGGTQTAAGVGSSIIGLRSNLSILDDPVATFEEIQSEKRREDAYQWYLNEYRSRLIPGSPEIIVTTRWHAQDIPGQLLRDEGDTWEVIRIPMECEEDDDPLGRNVGERLWPEWFTDQQATEAKRDPLRWAGMYQQRPLVEEGSWLNPEDIEIVEPSEVPKGIKWHGALDIALTEGSGDFSVLTIGGLGPDGTLYIKDQWRDRVTPDKIVERCAEYAQMYQLTEAMIDDDPAAKAFRTLAHKLFRQKGVILPLHPIPIRGRDKETRAAAFRGLAKMGSVKMVRGDWNAVTMAEINAFPIGGAGVHDDIVDTLGLLGQRAALMPPAELDKVIEKKPLRFALEEGEDGRAQTTATLDELWDDHARHSRRGVLRI